MEAVASPLTLTVQPISALAIIFILSLISLSYLLFKCCVVFVVIIVSPPRCCCFLKMAHSVDHCLHLCPVASSAASSPLLPPPQVVPPCLTPISPPHLVMPLSFSGWLVCHLLTPRPSICLCLPLCLLFSGAFTYCSPAPLVCHHLCLLLCHRDQLSLHRRFLLCPSHSLADCCVASRHATASCSPAPPTPVFWDPPPPICRHFLLVCIIHELLMPAMVASSPGV